MALRSRLALTTVVLAMVLVAAAPAFAAKDGRYKGTDITFKVKNNQISKVKVVLTYSCQKIGTGNLPDGEVRSLNVPGKFKVSSKGKFAKNVYIGTNNGVQDIFFEFVKGRFRKNKVTAEVRAGYTYSYYDANFGFILVKCYNTTQFKAKRV